VAFGPLIDGPELEGGTRGQHVGPLLFLLLILPWFTFNADAFYATAVPANERRRIGAHVARKGDPVAEVGHRPLWAVPEPGPEAHVKPMRGVRYAQLVLRLANYLK
jgi:hypothetical protein